MLVAQNSGLQTGFQPWPACASLFSSVGRAGAVSQAVPSPRVIQKISQDWGSFCSHDLLLGADLSLSQKEMIISWEEMIPNWPKSQLQALARSWEPLKSQQDFDLPKTPGEMEINSQLRTGLYPPATWFFRFYECLLVSETWQTVLEVAYISVHFTTIM